MEFELEKAESKVLASMLLSFWEKGRRQVGEASAMGRRCARRMKLPVSLIVT